MLGVKTLYIEPGSPWENGYIESFNGKMRNELLNMELFDTLKEAQVLCEWWRQGYNTIHAAQIAGLPASGTRGDRVAPRGHLTRDATDRAWSNIGSGTNIRGG